MFSSVLCFLEVETSALAASGSSGKPRIKSHFTFQSTYESESASSLGLGQGVVSSAMSSSVSVRVLHTGSSITVDSLVSVVVVDTDADISSSGYKIFSAVK